MQVNQRHMRPAASWITAVWLVIGSLLASASAIANTDPSTRVGRLSYLQGSVSFYGDRSEGWKPARMNYPVTSENSIWTEGPGRAEVRIGASAFRLADDTILDFVRLQDDYTQAYLQRGSLNVRTRNYGRDTYRDGFAIDTDMGRFTLEGNGRFRLDVVQGTEGRLTVFSGRGRFESADRNSVDVDAGRTLVVRGSQPPSFSFESTRVSDFDRWAEARDAAWDGTHTRYVRERVISPYMTGYEDLDAHGEWIDDREYGRVWTPRYVSSGWAPYRNGMWTYVRPWGWTWVDDAPWGFAPFHYGRWVVVGSRWCWWPGRYHHRPAYAPALVAWHGQPGLSINVSVSNAPPIGWFPLAPHEHYVPRYTNNVTYIRNVNYVTNNITVINPPARYVHAGGAAATFVQPSAFIHSKPVINNIVRPDRALVAQTKPLAIIDVAPPVRNAPVLAGGRAVAPTFAPGAAAGGAPVVTPPAPQLGGGKPGSVPQVVEAPRLSGGTKPAVMPPQGQPAVPPPLPLPVQAGAPTVAPTPVPNPAPAPTMSGQGGVRPIPIPTPMPQPQQQQQPQLAGGGKPGLQPNPSNPGVVPVPPQVAPAPAPQAPPPQPQVAMPKPLPVPIQTSAPRPPPPVPTQGQAPSLAGSISNQPVAPAPKPRFIPDNTPPVHSAPQYPPGPPQRPVTAPPAPPPQMAHPVPRMENHPVPRMQGQPSPQHPANVPQRIEPRPEQYRPPQQPPVQAMREVRPQEQPRGKPQQDRQHDDKPDKRQGEARAKPGMIQQ
jgi:hypothetical protein